jgi:hypothetical protein
LGSWVVLFQRAYPGLAFREKIKKPPSPWSFREHEEGGFMDGPGSLSYLKGKCKDQVVWADRGSGPQLFAIKRKIDD